MNEWLWFEKKIYIISIISIELNEKKGFDWFKLVDTFSDLIDLIDQSIKRPYGGYWISKKKENEMFFLKRKKNC